MIGFEVGDLSAKLNSNIMLNLSHSSCVLRLLLAPLAPYGQPCGIGYLAPLDCHIARYAPSLSLARIENLQRHYSNLTIQMVLV